MVLRQRLAEEERLEQLGDGESGGVLEGIALGLAVQTCQAQQAQAEEVKQLAKARSRGQEQDQQGGGGVDWSGAQCGSQSWGPG